MEKIEETLVLETNVENLFNLILSYWQDVQANYYKNYEPNITEKGTYNYGLTNIGGRPERKNNQLVIMGHTSFCPVNEDIEKMLARYEVVVFEAITLNVEKIKLIGKCIVPENMNYYRLFYDIWNRIKVDFGLPIESPEQQKEETIYSMPNGEPIQRGKPGRPRHDEDVKAEERLANGENEQTVKRDWKAELSKQMRILADEERTWKFIRKRARVKKRE